MASPLHSDLTGVREPDTETETVDTLDSQNTGVREQVGASFGTARASFALHQCQFRHMAAKHLLATVSTPVRFSYESIETLKGAVRSTWVCDFASFCRMKSQVGNRVATLLR